MKVTVTGEEVKSAMINAGIEKVNHHDCCICGVITYYFREGEQLGFNSGCGCGFGEWKPRPCEWKEAANWINMQKNEEARENIAKSFGIESLS